MVGVGIDALHNSLHDGAECHRVNKEIGVVKHSVDHIVFQERFARAPGIRALVAEVVEVRRVLERKARGGLRRDVDRPAVARCLRRDAHQELSVEVGDVEVSGLAAPDHDVGPTGSADRIKVHGAGVVPDVDPVLGQQIHFAHAVRFHGKIEGVLVPGSKDDPPPLPFSGGDFELRLVLAVHEAEGLADALCRDHIEELVPAHRHDLVQHDLQIEVLNKDQDLLGAFDLGRDVSRLVLDDESHCRASSDLKGSRSVAVGVDPVRSCRLIMKRVRES
mmetsp:Transcript_919/g.2258  ORF Transcript_919/g.2258 Transcript_919/m.2258 type:complete len:276 (+) Transcript_919:1157-1984(+)